MRLLRALQRLVIAALLASAATACGGSQGAALGTSHSDSRGTRVSAPSPGLVLYPVGRRQPAPTLTGRTLAGRPFSSASLVGHGLVAVNVWASWCAPCREEMPLLAHADRTSLRVLGVDERDRSSAAQTFAASLGATYPSLADPGGTLLHALPMLPQMGVPSTLFIDDHSRVAARVIGPVDARRLRIVLREVGGSS